jgi:hypothetical protein
MKKLVKIISNIKISIMGDNKKYGASKTLSIIHYTIIHYSTVTLLAKFLGLSTSTPLAIPT